MNPSISLAHLIVIVGIGVAFPTVLALVGILVNNGRFNTIDGRLLHIESSLGDVRERVAKVEERLTVSAIKP